MLQRIASYATMMAPTLRGQFDIMYGPMPMGIEPSPETGILVTLDANNIGIIASRTLESEQYAIKTAVNTVASGIPPNIQKIIRWTENAITHGETHGDIRETIREIAKKLAKRH